MNQTEKIAKGQHHLKMRVRQTYGNELSDSELMKIPLEGLHSIALQQIGEQEAYIEELEEKIAFLEKELANKEEKALLTRNEKKKIAKEVRKDREIEKIYKESSEFKGENKRLRDEIKELVCKLHQTTSENEALRTQLRLA